MRDHSKPSTRIAFLNAYFRDFQGIPAFDEGPENAGQKNPGHYQKNFDHRETKYSSQTDIIKHALTTKENFIGNRLLYQGLRI